MEKNRSLSPLYQSVPGSSRNYKSESFSKPRISTPRNIDPSPFDFSAYPLTTQKFDIDSTEERYLKLKDQIKSIGNNLNDCKKCSSYLTIVQELDEIITLYSRNRVKILNTFFEMYISLQEEAKKYKELNNKHQKLIQEIDINFESFADRKMNNKLKSLKSEIKHKNQVIAELNEKILGLEAGFELKAAIDYKQIESKQLLEKDKIIFNMNQIIKENLPLSSSVDTLYACKVCEKKQTEIEGLQSELLKQKDVINNLSKTKGLIKDSKNPVVKSMLELREMIVTWWGNKQDINTQIWKREGEELVQELVYIIEKIAESKIEATGRELRSAVHKKICEIEADFLDLSLQDDKVKMIMEKFLELPYLLKPLFDLLKDYEKKELIR
jgi:hypothetical protein